MPMEGDSFGVFLFLRLSGKKAWKSSSGYVTILCGKTEQLSKYLSMLQRNLPQVLRDEMLENMVAEAIPADIPGIIRQ